MSRAFRKLLRNHVLVRLTPFYRRYPYQGGASLKSVDSRGCIDLDMGFFCNRIPKAANSTVVTSLARWRFEQDIPSRQAKKLFLTPSVLSRAEVEKIDQLFRFAFVRNPYTRVLSAYLDKVERRAVRRGEESRFEDFLASLKRDQLHANAHWTPQADLLLLPFEQFDFIGKVENLTQDLETVRQRLLNVPIDAGMRDERSNATNANSKIAQYYTPGCAEIVRDLYARDFELFGYSTELPG